MIAGRCHCGNVEVLLETAHRPEDLPLSACSCSFCARHGARTTRDPGGRVRLVVHDPALLVRYRFGLRVTDFLLCGRCGIYVAAVMTEDDGTWATVNTNVFDDPDRFTRAATPADWEGESAAARRARRRRTWTPAEVALETA